MAPPLRSTATDSLLVVVLGDEPNGNPALDQALAARGCRILRPRLDTLPWKTRELCPDLFILDLALYGAGGPSSHYLRRLAGDAPILIIANDPALEFDFPDAFDFLLRPIDPARLQEDIDFLLASKNACPPVSLQQNDPKPFCTYLHDQSGLHFDERNGKLLEQGLLRRMRALGLADYPSYFAYLTRHRDDRQELKRLLSVLTIGETFFFRYTAHFDALAEMVLPEIIERNRSSRRLHLWSAGCSSGEEPYSLAILILERFPELADWDVSILATDINKRSLQQGRNAVYCGRSLRHVPKPLLAKWFTPLDNNCYRPLPQVQSLVRFNYLNLQSDDYPQPGNGTTGCDVILCRNVLIYFRLATVREVVERLSRALNPDGYFFMGHAETLLNISDAFRRHQYKGSFLYQLASSPPPQTKPTFSFVKTIEPPPPPEIEVVTTPIENPQEKNESIIITQPKENNRTVYCDCVNLPPIVPGIDELITQGFLLAGVGDYDEALRLCSAALQLNDLRPEIYLLQGLIYEQHQETALAIDRYRKALLLDLGFVMAHYQLGQLLERCGQTGDAQRQLRNVIRLLRRVPPDAIVPFSGELHAAFLLERCERELGKHSDHRG